MIAMISFCIKRKILMSRLKICQKVGTFRKIFFNRLLQKKKKNIRNTPSINPVFHITILSLLFHFQCKMVQTTENHYRTKDIQSKRNKTEWNGLNNRKKRHLNDRLSVWLSWYWAEVKCNAIFKELLTCVAALPCLLIVVEFVSVIW